MRGARPLCLAFAAGLVLAGCGADPDEPKRAVDARTEALHFFAADQPFVALLDTSTENRPELARTVRALGSVPALAAFAAGAGFLGRTEVDLSALDDLLTDDDPDDGLAASQGALGLRPRGQPTEDVLLVLVSELSEEMEEAVTELADTAGLEETDRFHEARLFAGRELALAVRDGVVLIGRDPAELRAALSLRDSDRDERLDEDDVGDLLDELPEQRPLVAYADVAALERTDPGVSALALGEVAWLRSLERAAISVTPEVTGVRLEIVAEIDEEAAERGETLGMPIPVGEEVGRTSVGRKDAQRLVAGEFADTSAFRDTVLELSPLVASASLSDDKLRATIVGSR